MIEKFKPFQWYTAKLKRGDIFWYYILEMDKTRVLFLQIQDGYGVDLRNESINILSPDSVLYLVIEGEPSDEPKEYRREIIKTIMY